MAGRSGRSNALIGLPERGGAPSTAMPPDARVAGRDARRSSPPTTARLPVGCTQRPRSDIPCTTPQHRARETGDCGTRSDRLRAEPCRRWRSRRLLLPCLRDRVVQIRLRHAGEGLLLSLLQHTPDPLGAVAEARALASAQDAVDGGERPGFDPRRNVRDGRSIVPRCRLMGPCSRRLDGEVRICLGEVQHDLCLSIVFDFRHELGDLLRDCLPSPRSHLRCL